MALRALFIWTLLSAAAMAAPYVTGTRNYCHTFPKDDPNTRVYACHHDSYSECEASYEVRRLGYACVSRASIPR